jgi:hypothetical protein
MVSIGSATTFDGVVISGEDVSIRVTVTSITPAVTPVPITTLFLSNEDGYSQISLTKVTPVSTPVPIESLFISGEDARAIVQEPVVQEPFNQTHPCTGPDFNGNGGIDWGDVIKLAYYYWGVIPDPCE